MSESTLCGAYKATRDEVITIKAPKPTKSWHPISHGRALEWTMRALQRRGMEPVREEYGLTPDKAQFFAVLDLESKHNDFGMSIGIGNSIDKKFPYRLVGGERVFVCSNLMFTGDFSVKRKHTSQIVHELPELIQTNVDQYLAGFRKREEEISAWKETECSEQKAAHTIMEAIEAHAIPVREAKRVYDEFRNPRHQEFREPTAWSLQNAFTEVHKERTMEPNASSRAMLHLSDVLRTQFPVRN